jgi:hypothetical protein
MMTSSKNDECNDAPAELHRSRKQLRFELPMDEDVVKAKLAQFPKTRRLFRARVIVGRVPVVVHSRDSVAEYMFGQRFSGFVVRIARQFQMIFVIASLVCITVGYLCIVGVLPDDYGFFYLGAIPVMAMAALLWNVHLAKAVTQTFDFWLLFFLTCVAIGGLIDGFRDSAGRICALTLSGFMLIFNSMADARSPRPPQQARQAFISTISAFVIAFVNLVSLIILYYLGRLPNFQQRLIPLKEGLVLDVQSIAVSCLTTHCFLQARFVVNYWRNPNALLLIRTKIEFEQIIQESASKDDAEQPRLVDIAPIQPDSAVPASSEGKAERTRLELRLGKGLAAAKRVQYPGSKRLQIRRPDAVSGQIQVKG